eukprot:NODE_34_length_36538_cov_0.612854.p13 type:complete len:284 gc:universal NODE_34_length_36538_cov_0.612854:20747-19896(-)
MEFLSGGLAACSAVTFTNPLEVIKTRLQLQGELKSSAVQKHLRHVVIDTIKEEGIRGIQKGLVPAYLYQFTMNACRLGSYEHIRQHLAKSSGGHSPMINIVSGASAGVFGAFMGSPLFLIKTRLQSATNGATKYGYQHNYGGIVDATRKIIKAEGIRGLYHGVDASMLRTAVGSAVQLSIYDFTKKYFNQFLPPNTLQVHFSASMVTGVFVCIFMNPFDVISTRMYNQGNHLYKNLADCFVKTIKTEGISGLYKGSMAHYMRIGPHTILTLTFLEFYKSILVK